MNPQSDASDDDLPAELDFSGGTRGKFFEPGTVLTLPIYLEAEVQAWLSVRAHARGVEIDQLVNELLRKDIELIDAAT